MRERDQLQRDVESIAILRSALLRLDKCRRCSVSWNTAAFRSLLTLQKTLTAFITPFRAPSRCPNPLDVVHWKWTRLNDILLDAISPRIDSAAPMIFSRIALSFIYPPNNNINK